jgi:hypothetical protein
MDNQMQATARQVGIFSAVLVAALLVAYAATLTVGLMSLASPDQPIGDPMVWMLEVLIILMMPAMVTLMVAVHEWAPGRARPFTLTALIFMALLAGLTCSVHFAILAVGRSAAFAALPNLDLLFSFKWPSVAYALDILGWDFFFPLSMLFAAPAFGGCRLARAIRIAMIVSGVLALAGLIGVPTGDMNLRNIGVVGYVPVFLVVVILLAALFWKTRPLAEAGSQTT